MEENNLKLEGTCNISDDEISSNRKVLSDFLEKNNIFEISTYSLKSSFIFYPNMNDVSMSAEIKRVILLIDRPRLSNSFCISVMLFEDNRDEPTGKLMFFGNDFTNIVEPISKIHEQGVYRIDDFLTFWNDILQVSGIDTEYYNFAITRLEEDKKNIEEALSEIKDILEKNRKK